MRSREARRQRTRLARWARWLGFDRNPLRRRTDRVETALRLVLLKDAPEAGTPDPYTSIQTAWVPARWQPPGMPSRTGVVLALAGAHKASTVRIWIDPSGAATDPPLSHRDVTGQVCVAVMATCLMSLLVLLAASAIVRQALDRRRLNAWADEWRAGEPLWSGRRR